ncbi:MAG: hypothetical protein HYS09_06850 [Chloroflexi bacterium]|nr:hypothetical protein [Chloroflexota bacterium]
MAEAVPLKRRRFGIKPGLRSLAVAVLLSAGAAGLATGLFLWLSGGGGESVRIVTGVEFPYPQDWSAQPLTESDRNAGLLLNLQRADPEASLLGRTVIARLPAGFDINQLADDAEVALRREIDNFDLLSKSVSPVGPFPAVRIYYRQQSDAQVPEDERPGEQLVPESQTLMTIIPTPNQTFYLTLRAEAADFQQVEEEGLAIMAQFADYVASVQ